MAEPMARMENLADQANLACPEITLQFHWTKKANAAGAHQDRPAHLDQLARLELTVSKVRWERPAQVAKTEHLDLLDHLAQVAKKARTAKPARKATTARTPKKARKDRLEIQERKANLAHLDQTETKAPMANLARKVRKAHLDLLVRPANLATRDPLAHLEGLANLVQMPTTARARNAAKPRPKWLKRLRQTRRSRSVANAFLFSPLCFNTFWPLAFFIIIFEGNFSKNFLSRLYGKSCLTFSLTLI